MTDFNPTSRRTFLMGTTAAAAGLTLAGFARTAHAAGSDKIKVALIGCGGRGSGAIRNCLDADPAIHVVAVADAFEGPAKHAAKSLAGEHPDRVDIPSDRVFVGLDAYQKAIDCGIDMIVTATPPGFRPFVYNAAIKAGKHVFMEKPCCVDAPGFHLLNETNKLAEEKGLKVGVGFQRRHTPQFIEAVQKIHDGALGRLILLQAYWNGGGIWNRRRQAGMTEMQYQVNNWYHFAWLSGDNITEQHIHNLDVCNWIMDDHPVEANGMGGCTARYTGEWKGTGQIFDHHFVEFTYKSGAKLYSQCRHMANTFGEEGQRVFGTDGSSWVTPRRDDKLASTAAKPKVRGKRKSLFGDSMVQEHHDLITAIKNNEKYCEGWHGATSSMTAVLGRMANYSGQVVKWDEAVARGISEFPAQLSWDAPAPVQQDADGNYPIPMPGVYQLYETPKKSYPKVS
jgi:myo-inositol 2-dehydrogenase / D-chiro-inositol 1-dehydrogenase